MELHGFFFQAEFSLDTVYITTLFMTLMYMNVR
jgi:hypothetical protein